MPRFHRLKVLRRLPHPGQGFTQGLIAEDGTVWESTGQYGQSTVRRYRLGQDEVEASTSLPPDLFAEIKTRRPRARLPPAESPGDGDFRIAAFD